MKLNGYINRIIFRVICVPQFSREVHYNQKIINFVWVITNILDSDFRGG